MSRELLSDVEKKKEKCDRKDFVLKLKSIDLEKFSSQVLAHFAITRDLISSLIVKEVEKNCLARNVKVH